MRYVFVCLSVFLAIACHTASDPNRHDNTDSLEKAIQQEEDKKRQDQLLQNKRLQALVSERNNVLANVTVDEPVFKSRLFGGFKDIRFHLFNRYNYTLDQVTLKVHYIKGNGNEIKTETLVAKNIAPGSRRELTAPDYTAGGKTLEVTIESVLCRSINLCYYRGAQSTVPDPYQCEQGKQYTPN